MHHLLCLAVRIHRANADDDDDDSAVVQNVFAILYENCIGIYVLSVYESAICLFLPSHRRTIHDSILA